MTEISQKVLLDTITNLMQVCIANEEHITALTAEVQKCISTQNALIKVLEELKPSVENLDSSKLTITKE